MTVAASRLWRDFRVQCGVVGGVMMREIVTRWGRRNLGTLWLFCEPLVFALPVIAVWSYVRAPFEHGVPMVTFVWSGYMPILIFRHVTGGALLSLRNNAALLYHSRLTPMDIFIGRQGLEALANLASVVISFFVLLMIGSIDWPYDYNLTLAGFLYTTWWSLAVALILTALSERYEIIPHFWAPISYLYIFFSGFFIMAEWLPPQLRTIALAIDPPLICYEITRAGMFGNLFQPYYDIPYLTFLLLSLTMLGLWLFRDVRKYIEFE